MKHIQFIAVCTLLTLLLAGCSLESLAERGVGLLDKVFAEDNLAPIPSINVPESDDSAQNDPEPAAPAVPAPEEPDFSGEEPVIPEVPAVPDGSAPDSVQTPPAVTTVPGSDPAPASDAAPEKVTPSHTDVSFFNPKETFQYLPKGISGVYACTYSVDDSKVASVSDTGTVTAVGPGTTKVKMHVESNGQYDFECIVRCKWEDKTENKDNKTDSKPENKTDKPVSKPEDDEPVLPPLPGETSAVSDGSDTAAVTASHSDATLFNPKEHFRLTPGGAGEGCAASYSSSDSSVATVDQNGTVTAAGPGTATITMTVDCGGTDYTFQCIVRCKW